MDRKSLKIKKLNKKMSKFFSKINRRIKRKESEI